MRRRGMRAGAGGRGMGGGVTEDARGVAGHGAGGPLHGVGLRRLRAHAPHGLRVLPTGPSRAGPADGRRR